MAHGEITDKDTGWIAFMKRMGEMKNATVKVGVLASSGAEEREEGSPLTKAEIAAVLEFGTKDGHIPERPALRSAYDENRAAIKALAAKLVAGIVIGKVSVPQALNILGAFLANKTKAKITAGAGVPPPNAPSTIAAKGSDRPWVDTGAVVGAISWQIADEKGGGEHE